MGRLSSGARLWRGEYAAIFHEFTGQPETVTESGETGLMVSGPLSSRDPVKDFHEAAEWRAEHEFDAPLPGLASSALPLESRARILAAIGDPVEWRAHVLRWKEYARDVRAALGAGPAPAAEYRLYQHLLAAWPAIPKEFAEAGLENAGAFVAGLFESRAGDLFRKAFIPFAEALVARGAALALAAFVLQCTAPGVPQIADGEEIGADLPLAERIRLLAATGEHPAELAGDARLRLFVLRTLLGLRARRPELFGRTKYLSQKVRGKFADHCVVFTRQSGEQVLLVAVPRALPPPGEPWEKAALEICGITQLHWRNVFTGAEATGPYLPLSEAFHHLPVAVFLAESGDPAESLRRP
jgi:maltooligosyltrehalose synthase